MSAPPEQDVNARSLLTLETPETIEQIQGILRRAREKEQKVRVVGSQHSTEDAIYGRRGWARGIVLSMTRFDGIHRVDNKRPGDGEDGLRGRAWVRIGAGVTIAEQPYIHPVPPEHAQLRRWLARKGLAVNLVGGVAQQTVVGFLGTGSSGGSWSYCLHDMVVEIELVDGNGVHRTLRRFTADEAEHDMFRAAGVSLGLLGVIVSVTLEMDDDYHLVGTETFVRVAGVGPDQRGEYVTSFCREEEYGRLIWWPQTKVMQRWSCRRVAPRRDMQPIPYLPAGVEHLTTQIRACLLQTTIGNLGSLKALREVPAKLSRARVPEYLKLHEAQQALHPPKDRALPVEVLERAPHYHWTQTRYRAPRRLVEGAVACEGKAPELVEFLRQCALVLLDEESFERFVARVLIAGADEVFKRMLFLAEHGDPNLRPEPLRAELDRYDNLVSSMLQPDRDVGPIGVGDEIWEKIEALAEQLFGRKVDRIELADYLGETLAAILLPILPGPEADDARLAAEIVHAFVRRAVYDLVPIALDWFFKRSIGVTTGFYDHALDGLAVDRRINHHLVQTKFSEIWIKGSEATKKALDALTRYLEPAQEPGAGETEPGSPAASEPLSALRGALCALPKTADGVGAFLEAMAPDDRFKRQGVYSHELYGGRAHETFLLHPGQGEACKCQGRCACDRNWVRVNLFWFAYNEGDPRGYFKQFWDELEKLGNEVEHRWHWGKEMPERPRWDRAFQENIEKFLVRRGEMDPCELFYTDYWKRVLEGGTAS
jgi:hypothetical protein